MASLYIRDMDDALLRALRIKAAEQGVTIRSLAIKGIELLLKQQAKKTA